MPSDGYCVHEHTKRWVAIDHLYAEWDGMPVASVGYGWSRAHHARTSLRVTLDRINMVVVDGTWSVVGSANMDERSMELNEENVLAIRDAGLAADIERGLLEDFGKSQEFELERWKRRPLYRHLLERISRAAIEQY